MSWTLPNRLTLARIAITPVVAALPFIAGYWPKVLALVVFIGAAITDIFDGRVARRRNLVTDLGKQLDPLADKLLLLATLIPIWWISQERKAHYGIPLWGSVPLWVCLILIGREVAMTVFRMWASGRGVVIAAHGPGKLKTVFQSIFIGATIAWFAFKDAIKPLGWERSPIARVWNEFHGGLVAVTLIIATALTLYSFAIYLYRYRALFSR